MNEFKTHIDSGTQHNTICEWIMPYGRYLAKILFNIQDDVVNAHFSISVLYSVDPNHRSHVLKRAHLIETHIIEIRNLFVDRFDDKTLRTDICSQ